MKNNFVLQLIQNTARVGLVVGLLGISLNFSISGFFRPYPSQNLWLSIYIFVPSLFLFGISEIVFQLMRQNQILEEVLKKLDEK